MSEQHNIDDIFRKQLGDMQVSDPNAMWQRMEQKLDADHKPDGKKKYALLLLLVIAGTAGSYFAFFNNGSKKAKELAAAKQQQDKQQPVTNMEPVKQNQSSQITTSTNPNTDVINFTLNGNNNNNTINTQPFNTLSSPVSGYNTKAKTNVSIQAAPPQETDQPTAKIYDEPSAPASAEQKPVVTTVIATQQQPEEKAKVVTTQQTKKEDKTIPTVTASAKTEKKLREKNPISFGISGGIDLFARAKQAGGYTGVQLTVPLNKKVSLVTGVQVSSSKMEEDFVNAEKVRTTPDRSTDATLQRMTVLQVPILYEQGLSKAPVKFKAGITPTYILDANIYNLPASGSNPALYKKFSIDELHRLNLLFTAGVSVAVTKNVDLELKGNYGLTELVKNSYINQAHGRGNFKSAQLGIVIKSGKKKSKTIF